MENSTAEKEGLEILRRDAEQSAEWIKSAAVSVDDARRSMDRLDTLERNKPTLRQVGRYGAIGGLGGAAAGAVGNVIEHGSALRGATPKAQALNLAASAAKGAIGGGALPLLRSHSDRHAEMGTLRKFMNQDKTAASEEEAPPKRRALKGAATLAAPLAAASAAAEAAPRLVGSELLYHGTSPAAAQHIRQEGLNPAHGGTGAASWEHANPEFKTNSQGHVHVTKSRPNAEFYSRLSGALESGEAVQPMDLLSSKGTGKGTVLPIAMPFDQVKSSFHLDPNGDLANDLRSSKTVPSKFVSPQNESFMGRVWRGRPSNYLSYVKNNPKRVAAGAALAAAAPALMYGGYRAGQSLAQSFGGQEKAAALGAAPLWRRQAGFTPPGMQTAAQRLQKSMSMGKVDTTKGLKPLNIKVGHTIVQIVKKAGLGNIVRQVPQALSKVPAAAKNVALGVGERNMHLNEVAGLGVLAVPGLDTMQSRVRARMAGDKSPHGAEKRQLLGEGAHAALDVGGLGLLAAPAIAHLKHAFANSGYAGNVAQNGPGMKSHSQLPPFRQAALQVKESSPLKRVGELVTGSKAGRLREAALRHADRAAEGKLPRELKAARKLRGLAKVEEGRVGKVQGALIGSAALGAVSDSTGLAEKARGSKKEAGVGVGAGMTTSQYSGPLSYGPFKMTSGIPAFRRSSPTKRDESLEGAAWMYGENKEASMAATGAMSPAGRLSSSQRIGAPKVTGFAGPSIADVSKPKGFGTPLPGAQKNQL